MITSTNSTNNNVSFQRRLTPKEAKKCEALVQKALKKVLKKDSFDIIIHSSCMPSKAGQNTGIGSILSEGAKKLILAIKQLGVTGIQIEPDGLRKGFDASPYVSDTFAKNVLMIPLEKLKSKKYGFILSKKTFADIVNNRPNKGTNRVDYNYVFPKYNEALKEAFDTFSKKLKNIEKLPSTEKKVIAQLADDFSKFKAQKAERLEKNSLYNVLSEINGNDYYKNWPAEDRDLFLPENAAKAKIKIKQLKEKYADKIDNFLFSQMLVDKERQAANKFNSKLGIKTIGDSQVAFSNVDIWANPDCFMKNYFLGCPPDYFSKTGQDWGFAALDPEKIINKDGSLGKAGRLLYDKFYTMFKDNPGGVRIDHTIGLIDPFVYPVGELPNSPMAGRLYSSPNLPDLGKYAKKTTEEYGSLMEIVISAAKKAGIDPHNLICEDLGTVTKPTVNVMKKLNLRGIRVTQFADNATSSMHRGKNIPENYIGMIGSHDNASLIEFAKSKTSGTDLNKDAQYLAKDLIPTKSARKAFYEKTARDPLEFAKAKLAELFASPTKEPQVFFADLAGISDTYNVPGTAGAQNWSLRLSDDFINYYHQNLQQNKGLNMPEILKMAIESKNSKIRKENKKLLEELDKYAKILKEKE